MIVTSHGSISVASTSMNSVFADAGSGSARSRTPTSVAESTCPVTASAGHDQRVHVEASGTATVRPGARRSSPKRELGGTNDRREGRRSRPAPSATSSRPSRRTARRRSSVRMPASDVEDDAARRAAPRARGTPVGGTREGRGLVSHRRSLGRALAGVVDPALLEANWTTVSASTITRKIQASAEA